MEILLTHFHQNPVAVQLLICLCEVTPVCPQSSLMLRLGFRYNRISYTQSDVGMYCVVCGSFSVIFSKFLYFLPLTASTASMLHIKFEGPAPPKGRNVVSLNSRLEWAAKHANFLVSGPKFTSFFRPTWKGL